MDLSKTQFLVVDHGIRAFRRRRRSFLWDGKREQPIRRMEWLEWNEFRKEWPKEVEEDQLRLITLWTLEEIKPKEQKGK
jgi:hypothetical protein